MHKIFLILFAAINLISAQTFSMKSLSGGRLDYFLYHGILGQANSIPSLFKATSLQSTITHVISDSAAKYVYSQSRYVPVAISTFVYSLDGRIQSYEQKV